MGKDVVFEAKGNAEDMLKLEVPGEKWWVAWLVGLVVPMRQGASKNGCAGMKRLFINLVAN